MKTHCDLNVWKDSTRFVLRLYQMTSSFPKEELYGITSQFRRAAVSVPTNISEGAARGTGKEFVRFLYISFGSLSEMETLLILSLDLGFITKQDYLDQHDQIKKMSSQLSGLIKSISTRLKAKD